MGPTLHTLATELVELIARFLGPADFCSLRSACKNLHQKSLHSFGAFFTTIRTDLSQRSLQKLQLISEDDTLRLYVQKLLIKPIEGEILGQGFQWDRHSSGHLEGRLPGLEKLQYLLAHNLPNCRSFHIFTLGGEEDESDALTSSDVVALMLRIVPSISIDAPTSLPLKSFIVDFTSPIMDPIPWRRYHLCETTSPRP